MDNTLDRLKVLLDSSTPIVVVETVEETRATRMVRMACAALNIAAFEWTIATGLSRCGSGAVDMSETGAFPPGGYRPGDTHLNAEENAKALYNSREPAQMLANLEGISIEAAFILKDLHRHMEDPVVVRRLRDVGQTFASNRRTVILTAPKITIPPELASLVEFLELPLPDKQRLRQIIDEMMVRVSKTHTLQRKLDPAGMDSPRSARSRRRWSGAMRLALKRSVMSRMRRKCCCDDRRCSTSSRPRRRWVKWVASTI